MRLCDYAGFFKWFILVKYIGNQKVLQINIRIFLKGYTYSFLKNGGTNSSVCLYDFGSEKGLSVRNFNFTRIYTDFSHRFPQIHVFLIFSNVSQKINEANFNLRKSV